MILEESSPKGVRWVEILAILVWRLVNGETRETRFYVFSANFNGLSLYTIDVFAPVVLATSSEKLAPLRRDGEYNLISTTMLNPQSY
jgi:hypothetical protein